MGIEKIDKNFATQTTQKNTRWLEASEEIFTLYGIQKTKEGYCRISPKDSTAFSPELQFLCKHTAGGVLTFETDASEISLKVTVPSVETMPHMTLLGSSGFDLYVQNKEQCVYYKSFVPVFCDNISEAKIEFATKQPRQIYIYFPLYQCVSQVEIGIEQDAKISQFQPYQNAPIVFYGSSITQGGCASRSGNAYPAIVSRLLEKGFVNLGFSGNAKGEITMAQYIASLSMEACVIDYDHNAPTPEHLENTLLPFYKCIRNKHPKIPLFFVSRPDYNETNAQDVQRRQIIKQCYTKAKKHDSNVYFIDGATLFSKSLRDSSTVDGCHPNDFGFVHMGKKIASVLQKALAKK